MKKPVNREEEYARALNKAFDSKTPAQHLADSKYMRRGLGSILSSTQLKTLEIVDALRESGGVEPKSNSCIGRYLLYLSLDKNVYPDHSERARALFERMKRNRTIREIKVCQWVPIHELTQSIKIGDTIRFT